MKTKYFKSVRKGSVGDGSVGDLVDWLEQYINVLFPENGIEYWADNRYGGADALKRFQPAPKAECGDEGVHHYYCYVREGSCEGRIIEIRVHLRSGRDLSVVWAKSFGDADECWEIARAISEALESIFTWEEIPEIVDMAAKLPRSRLWRREVDLPETVTIDMTGYRLLVSTENGNVFDDRDWSSEGVNAKFYPPSRLDDWVMVLTNMNVSFQEVIDGQPARSHSKRHS